MATRSRKAGAKSSRGVRNYTQAEGYPARLQQIGQALKAARERIRPRRSQWAAASEVGISQPALSNYESGRREPPLTVFVDLCKLYAIDGPGTDDAEDALTRVLFDAGELWG